MLLNEFYSKKTQVNEGGNIFKGDLVTSRINRADVMPTVAWLERYTGLPLQDNMLGTTGRKDTSGDLDLGVSQNSITKDQLVSKLSEVAVSMGVEPSTVIKKSGISVHFRTPIAGDPKKGFVQTDFMFTDDLEWTKFAAAASGTSTYKGAHKHVLMSSIAASLGLKWSPTTGLLTRDTGKLLSKDPDYIAEILLGKGNDRDNLASVESILNAIKDDPERDEKLMAARETLAREGVSLPEAKQMSGPAGQVKGMDRARTVKPRPFVGSQPHPFQGKLVGGESRISELDDRSEDNFTADDIKQMERMSNLDDIKRKAIQLISAPSKRPITPQKQSWLKQTVMGKKDKLSVIKLMYDLMLSGEGMKVIGTKTSMEPNSYRKVFGEDDNPTDKVTMDIPLLIRIMEYAREDAKTDMDLHNVAEKLISLSKEGLTLGMDSYDSIIVSDKDMTEANTFTDARMNAIKAGEKTFTVNGKTYPVTGDTKDELEASESVSEAKKKPKPTNPELWSRAKAAARSKFEVYPSAYANAWASRWYKGKGGGWRMG